MGETRVSIADVVSQQWGPDFHSPRSRPCAYPFAHRRHGRFRWQRPPIDHHRRFLRVPTLRPGHSTDTLAAALAIGKTMKRRLWLTVVGVAMLAVFIGGAWFWLNGQKKNHLLAGAVPSRPDLSKFSPEFARLVSVSEDL